MHHFTKTKLDAMRSLKKKYFILLICVATVVVAVVYKLPLLRFQTQPARV